MQHMAILNFLSFRLRYFQKLGKIYFVSLEHEPIHDHYQLNQFRLTLHLTYFSSIHPSDLFCHLFLLLFLRHLLIKIVSSPSPRVK